MFGVYNRFDAVEYATVWANKVNPLFMDDHSVNDGGPGGGGGDCTNFMSQALYIGGWKMIDGLRIDMRAWYCPLLDHDRTDRSFTWGAALPFSHFLASSGRAYRCGRDDLFIGDLIQQVHPNGQAEHTMMVTKVEMRGNSRRIYYSAHSTDRLNYSFDDLTQGMSDRQLADGYRFWKVRDFYPVNEISYVEDVLTNFLDVD